MLFFFNISYTPKTAKQLTQAQRHGSIQIDGLVSIYEYKDVPTLVEEPHTDNVNNYRYSLTYELASLERSDGTIKKFSNTWEGVAKPLSESQGFGKQLKKVNIVKEEAKKILEARPNLKEFYEQRFSKEDEKIILKKS
ncbi:MAG: hypothetical protein ACPGQR_05540 [Marinirhabdus sp.]